MAHAPEAAPTSPGGEATSWMDGIEILRGVAALSVVFHHCWSLGTMPRFSGYQIVEGFGTWGVSLFFVLSGYLLVAFFWGPTRRTARSGDFLIRRFFRLAPGYYFNALILFVFFVPARVFFTRQGVDQLLANLTFTHQWFAHTISNLNANGAWWTLSVEAALYVAMPLLAFAMRKRPLVGAAAITALGLTWVLFVAWNGEGIRTHWFGQLTPGDIASDMNQRIYLARLFPGQLGLFAIGMGARWIAMFRPQWLTRLPRPSVPTVALALVPSLLWLFKVENASDYRRWIWFSGFPLVLGLLFVPALLIAGRPVAPPDNPATKVAVWLGQRSYGIYLWHFPVILSFYGRGQAMLPPENVTLFKVLVIVAVSILLGAISYSRIEEPARRYGRDLARRLTTGSTPPTSAANARGTS